MKVLATLVRVVLAIFLPGFVRALQLKDAFGYPLHDAMIAAGALVESRRLSLFGMKQVIGALHSEKVAEDFATLIPEILDQALTKSDIDAGRIIEYADERSLSVGENYVLDIRSATPSCVLSEPETGLTFTEGFPPGAAYASHILAHSPKGGNYLDSIDPRAYNRSMLLEADVMELPDEGFMFVPKRFCLDLRDVQNGGVAGGFGTTGPANSLPSRSRVENVRPFAVGTSTRQVRATANQVGWIDIQRNAGESEIVERSFEQPKAELKSFIDVWNDGDNELCPSIPEGTQEFVECLARAALISGTPSFEASFTAVLSYFNMRFAFRDWSEAMFGSELTTDAFDASILPFDFDLQDLQDVSLNIAPLLLDRSVASRFKNSPLLSGLQVNPFWNTSELRSLIESDGEDFTKTCVEADLSASGDVTWI